MQLCLAAVGPFSDPVEPVPLSAAALNCCAHMELGQHEVDQPVRIGNVVSDVECGTCHSQGVEALPARRPFAAATTQERFGVAAGERLSQAPASRPERPQWRALS